MSPVGRAYLAEWEAARLAEREAQPITMTCLWCDWTLAGTLKTARDAHRAHRAAQHPERTVKRRKTRHRPSPTLVAGGKTLDDNIAGARSCGSPAAKPATSRAAGRTGGTATAPTSGRSASRGQRGVTTGTTCGRYRPPTPRAQRSRSSSPSGASSSACSAATRPGPHATSDWGCRDE